MANGEFRLSEYDETIRMVLESGGEFRIYPKGTSMLPLIRAGIDSVVLTKPTGRLKQGDIAFYLRDNGAYVLHRIIRVDADGYTLCGDNQIVPEKGIADRHIIGVVTRIYRGEKPVSEKSFGYGIYLLLWKNLFVRRVCLKLRRMFGKGRV